MIISLLNEKGGVGKTTLSINLACCLKAHDYSVLLVDSDTQGSLTNWHQRNEGSKVDLAIINVQTINKDILKYAQHYDFIIVDGAPQVTIMAARTVACSDVVLIPVTPSRLDVDASERVTDLIKERQACTDGAPKAAFVINRQKQNTKIGSQIRGVVEEELELPVFTSRTFSRVSYVESIARGESVLDSTDKAALSEIHRITQELLEFIR